jgi:inorganic triphosphatase YgiF
MTSQHTTPHHAAAGQSTPSHAATDRAGDPLPDSDEVEWQFDAPDLDRIADWLRSRPAETGPRVEAGPVVEQADDYFDTADWRIYRAGFTLRLRRRIGRPAEATLKALSSSTTGVTTRREINEPIEAAQQSDGATLGRLLHAAPGSVGAWLRGTGAAATLGLLFTVHTRRTLFFLHDQDRLAGEVALDETHVEVRGQVVGALRRVEIEARGPMAALDALVRSLAADCDLTPAQGSKFEFGLAAAGISRDIVVSEDQPG